MVTLEDCEARSRQPYDSSSQYLSRSTLAWTSYGPLRANIYGCKTQTEDLTGMLILVSRNIMAR